MPGASEVDSLLLHHRIVGNPSGEMLLLIPGLAMPQQMWPTAFLNELSEAGFSLLLVDNRDSGRSFRDRSIVTPGNCWMTILQYLFGMEVQAPYCLRDMVADLVSVLDYRGFERVHVAGMSLGGMIAQEMALSFPERVRSLSCISTASGNVLTGVGDWRAVLALMRRPTGYVDRESIRARLHRLHGIIGTPGNVPESSDEERLLDALMEGAGRPDGALRQIMAILASGNRCSRLPQISAPSIVIHGTADPLLPFRAGQEIARMIPGSRLFPMEGMGHDLPRKYSQPIAKIVAEHCKRSG